MCRGVRKGWGLRPSWRTKPVAMKFSEAPQSSIALVLNPKITVRKYIHPCENAAAASAIYNGDGSCPFDGSAGIRRASWRGGTRTLSATWSDAPHRPYQEVSQLFQKDHNVVFADDGAFCDDVEGVEPTVNNYDISSLAFCTSSLSKTAFSLRTT